MDDRRSPSLSHQHRDGSRSHLRTDCMVNTRRVFGVMETPAFKALVWLDVITGMSYHTWSHAVLGIEPKTS